MSTIQRPNLKDLNTFHIIQIAFLSIFCLLYLNLFVTILCM